VDLIGPYTIKGKDGTEIDFMCLTMIDPATSWFEIVELPVLERPDTGTAKDKKGHKGKRKTPDKDPYFDKSSAIIAKLVVDIHVVEILSTTMVVNLSFTSSPYAIHLDSNVS
jgi:hypothetical protein